MGWKGFTTTKDRIMGEVADKVIRYAPCDLITVKLLDDRPVKKVLIPTSGGPHATLAAEYMGIYHDVHGCEVTCCYVIDPNADDNERHRATEWIHKTIRLTGLEGKASIRLVEGKKVATALVMASKEYDLIVLGASKEGLFSSVLLGEIPEKAGRYSQTQVMIVQRYEGAVKSLIKKALG
jgi:nucleotide-binding universal stress UspA family protein